MYLTFLYLHAAQPSIPRDITGKIQNISSTFSNVRSIVSMNWLPPENENETDISYYETTLYGPDTTSTTFKVPTSASLPYVFVLSNGNFITANVSAVDMCDQSSKASISALTTEPGDTIPNSNVVEQVEQQRKAIISLSIFLGLSVIIIIVILLLFLSAVVLRRLFKRYTIQSQSPVEISLSEMY